MLGQATAPLAAFPRRWLARIWGTGDIHARQKWSTVWRQLAKLPGNELRLLDAGCGGGDWALEIASRRPLWRVVGLDRDPTAIQHALRNRRRMGVANAAFLNGNFLEFEPAEPFDVVLAVASAHYLVKEGRGQDLIRKFRQWLRPGGLLFLYGPRACDERPLLPLPGRVGGDWGFRAADLHALIRQGGLSVRDLVPQVDYFASAAKLVSDLFGNSRTGRMVSYPAQIVLTAVGEMRPRAGLRRSVAYLLIASKE